MAQTYRAVEAYEPGKLRLVEKPLREPGRGQVRIRVEACGVCHSDAVTVETGKTCVPGHEVVGVIDALGADVTGWQTGQRVGVGFFGGQCGRCEPCRLGDFVNCQNPIYTGMGVDGGYAEMIVVEERALVTIPDAISSVDAAPLLCAGVTTYNALRNAGLHAGDLVAVHGIGGLGHLGIQYARRMGFRTVAIARGPEKEVLAKKLGAHIYIDSNAGNPAEALKNLGGAKAILATAANSASMGPLLPGLAPRGRLIVAGVDMKDISVNSVALTFGGRSVQGVLTGTPIEEEETLKFSLLADVRPMIETMPLEQAAEAYSRMMNNNARFRIVLTTGN